VPPRTARHRLFPALALSALVGTAFGAGAVIGGVGKEGPGNVPAKGAEQIRVEPVPVQQVGSKRGSAPGKIVYYETSDPLPPIPPGPGGYVFRKCPQGSSAVNGYYYRRGIFEGFGLDDQGSSPVGYRKWAFYWDNVAQDSGGKPMALEGVTVGIVCDRAG
jgi:hypothetical protein